MEDSEAPGAEVRHKRPGRKGHGGDDESGRRAVLREQKGNGLIERTNEGHSK